MNFLLLLFILLSITYQVSAQFGIKKKTKKPNGGGVHYEDVVDFENDPELQAAIQQFADMSPEEMIETINELKESLGDSDPETMKELDSILEDLSRLDAKELEDSLYSIMEEEAVAKAMGETLELLSQSGEEAWEKIIANKDLILDAVIQTGTMSEDEISLYKSDPSSWENELKEIWNELRGVAEASGNDEL